MTAQRYTYLYGASRHEVARLRWLVRHSDLESALSEELYRSGMKYWLLPIGVSMTSLVHLVVQVWFPSINGKEVAFFIAVALFVALVAIMIRACRKAYAVRSSGQCDIRFKLNRTLPTGAHERIYR